MIVTVFRSRLNPETQSEYQVIAAKMSKLVQSVQGYLSHKSFTAEDGERVTIVEFEDEEGMREWATHSDHVAAKRMGRNLLFSEYRVQICDVKRDSANRKTSSRVN